MHYQYSFTNSIVFGLVMNDREICKGLLERIFPGRKVKELRTHEGSPEIEKTIIVGIDSRSVRLDVKFEDDEAWYDIEMQARDEKNIPKRSGYAHAAMDTSELRPGDDYNELKNSYVIFLCCFDPLKENLPVYRFRMFDDQNGLPLQDGTYTIILNSKADEESVPEELKALFRYMNETGTDLSDPLIRTIDQSVESWNTPEGRNRIMLYEWDMKIKERKIREEGIAEGKAETARNLKTEGVAIDVIARSTGLTVEEIEKL